MGDCGVGDGKGQVEAKPSRWRLSALIFVEGLVNSARMKIMLVSLVALFNLSAFGAEKWFFVGCRPSAGECFNSCADHRAKSEEHSPLCKDEYPRSGVACYCKVGSEGLDDTAPRTKTGIDFSGR